MPNLHEQLVGALAHFFTLPATVKGFFAAGWVTLGQLAAQGPLDLGRLNALLNLALLVIVFVAAIPLVRSKRKDSTIKDLNDSLLARDRRIRDLTDEAADAKQQTRQIEQGVAHLKEQLVASEARYEEQSKFTAEAALGAVMTTMDHGEQNQARRHLEVMEALRALGAALERH